MMLGDKISAADAEQMGMIYKVSEDSSLQQDAMTIANTLGNMPTKGIGLTKKLLNKSMNSDLDSQLRSEGDEQVVAAASYDYNEGVNAFLEKRKPLFKGE
jgi:2-(1,2-epoxy-1,2-dihydrophenyl)acetyl-CoA isomerase